MNASSPLATILDAYAQRDEAGKAELERQYISILVGASALWVLLESGIVNGKVAADALVIAEKQLGVSMAEPVGGYP